MRGSAAAVILATLLTGCASLQPLPPLAVNAADAACHAGFQNFNEAVDRAGVRDAEFERIPGFPSLRIDRLHAALASRAPLSELEFSDWVRALNGLGLHAYAIEFAHLPVLDGADFSRLSGCSAQLEKSILREPALRKALLERARVPDRYSNAARVAGLYAITRAPFFAGVQAWEREHAQAMREAAAHPRPARQFVPGTTAPSETIAGQARVDASQQARLLAAHAPLLEIETAGAFDEIGTPAWQRDGRIGIDTAQPAVYERLTQTLVGGKALTQLVYTLWFPERPKSGSVDLLGGVLDGVILRITLAPDGTPLMLDTIHACGCYHMFFPAPGVALRPDAPSHEEWAFVPASLPAWQPGSRFVVRFASATHYVLGVTASSLVARDATAYARRPEGQLKLLPTPDGRSRSLYGPDGLVAGTERAERFLFWPMGIASAGAMRQWGHHATAFVGRRHFDDADLLDVRFVFPPFTAP